MKTITIGNSDSRDISPLDTGWLRDRIRELRSRKMAVCVKIRINSPPVDILLKTPGCPSAPSQTRRSRPEEDRLFDLWERKGMNREDFEIDQLISFVREIEHV
jgi:hypothetical protein